jgi:cell wall-associated NlpC family hydrolase
VVSSARARLHEVLLVGILAAVTVVFAGGSAVADPAPTEVQARRTVLTLQEKMAAATEDYNQGRDALDAGAKRQAEIARKSAELVSKVEAATAVVSEFAAEAYRGGTMSMFSAIMSSGSPQTFLDQMATLEVINSEERIEIERLLGLQAELDEQEAKLEAERKSQVTQLNRLRARRAQIEADLAKWTALQDRYGFARASRAGERIVPSIYIGPASGRARKAVQFAYAQMGKPYSWGADGPGSYDCSGLTMAAWGSAGVSMAHSARGQYNAFPKVKLSQMQPGDLVYYPGHIAIYVGDGMVIHAPQTGDVVRKVPTERAGSNIIGAARPS